MTLPDSLNFMRRRERIISGLSVIERVLAAGNATHLLRYRARNGFGGLNRIGTSLSVELASRSARPGTSDAPTALDHVTEQTRQNDRVLNP
jgi:hypothetical protein